MPRRSCWSWTNSTPTGWPASTRRSRQKKARRLAERLEIHHTPKHGSWLNMAEIEPSVLARQCLAERMNNQEHLATEVAAWEQARNVAACKIDWRFTTAEARIRLHHLYPQTKRYLAEILGQR